MIKRFNILLLAVLIVILSDCSGKKTDTAEPTPVDTAAVMVMQIRKCARLYTAEYQVHKIITYNDDVRLKGSLLGAAIDFGVPFSSRQIAIPVEATLKAYIDFGTFTDQNVVRRGRKIEIILPDPQVEMTSSRVNHDEIRRQVSLIRSNFSDKELTAYERQGREAILKSVPETGILDMAREGAAHVLVPIIAQLGYREEDITVTFRKDFTAENVPVIIKKTEN